MIPVLWRSIEVNGSAVAAERSDSSVALPVRNVTLTRLPNFGYEADAYLWHILSRLSSVGDFAEVTAFLQGRAEDHIPRWCSVLRTGLLQPATRHGYVGLSDEYRLSHYGPQNETCGNHLVQWAWRALQLPHALSQLGRTSHAVFALSGERLRTLAQPARLTVLRRAHELVRNGSEDSQAALYAPCRRYSEGKKDLFVSLMKTHKLEAIGMEQLWHVLLGMPDTLPLAHAPCARNRVRVDAEN